MRRALPLVLLLLFTALLSAQPVRAHAATPATPPTVSLCDEANEWPPYTYYRRVNGERSQELTGFTVELMRLIAQRRGFSVSFEMLPWKRCVEMVRSGQINGFLNAISTPERERDFLVSAVIYETRLLYLWSRRRHPQGLQLRNQTELAPLRIGGVHGYSYSQLDQIDQNTLIRAPNYRSLVQMLHHGRVDVALINEGVMLGHAALGMGEFANEAEIGQGALEDRAPSLFHIMFTRARPEAAGLHALVNAELALMERSGELARLRALYLRP